MSYDTPESLSVAHVKSPEREPDATPDLTELKAYTRRKQEVAEALRTLLGVFKHCGDEASARQGHELMVKLAEDRFTLAVLGQFKRGKSSLMNAIIGRELLPTGVLPLTSVVTILRFGSPECLVVQRQNSPFAEKLPVSSLAHLVTERGNPSNQRQLSAVYVELPVPLLRRGLEFVDTPGVGSVIEANTATTYAFLPSCDAAILVTSVDTPMTQTEIEFLRHIRSLVRRLFLVVNKIDLASPAEREEVLSFIATAVQKEIDSEEVLLFPVSAQEGLQAKMTGNAAAYVSSGLRAFEEALSRFLSGERGSALLVSVLDKALRLTAAAASRLELSRRSRETSPERLRENLAAFNERVKPVAARAEEMTAQLREELTTQAVGPLLQELDPILEAVSDEAAREWETMLAPMRWESGHTVMERCARLLEERFHDAVTAWVSEQLDRATPACEQILRQKEGVLSEHLRTVAGVAAEIFHTPFAPEAIGNELPSRLADLNLPGFSLPRPEPASPLRGAVAVLPASLVKRPLRRWVRESLVALRRAYQEAVAEALEHRAGEIADAFGGALERYARNIRATVRQPSAAKGKGRKQDGHDSAEPSEWIEQLHQIEQRLVSLREQVLEQCGGTRDGATTSSSPQEATAPDRRLDWKEQIALSVPAAMAAKNAYLPRDLPTRGCPLCDHLTQWKFNFFSHFQHQLAANAQIREDFARTGGFCAQHTWQLVTLSSPRGVCLGHSSLTARLAGELARAAEATGSVDPSVRPLLQDQEGCPVCVGASQVAAAYADRLAAWLEQSSSRALYARSQGLCLPHLDLLLARVRTPQVARFLLEEAARHFEEVTEDMLNYALKHDAIRRPLESEDEKDAFYRAITHVVGDQRLVMP